MSQYAQEIEAALTKIVPDGYRRINQSELQLVPKWLNSVAAWRVDLPKGRLQHPFVDYLILLIDENFPFSEPRIIAPQINARGMPRWPHVERTSLLCLKTTKYSAPPGERALTTLQHAIDLLNMNQEARIEEFQREFVSYWSFRVSDKSATGYAMLEGRAESRDIYFQYARNGNLVFADDSEELLSWLDNVGCKRKEPLTTRLVWLDVAPVPETYPVIGRDVIKLANLENIERHVRAGVFLPVVLGFLVDNAPIFAAIYLQGASEKCLRKGFRKNSPLPKRHVVRSFYSKRVVPLMVERVDPSWCHGRDSNSSFNFLRSASVGIIGCGAIGGFLARGLAQAGVGNLTLVDYDEFKPANIGRHVLGAEWIGKLKVDALDKQIRRDFPHIKEIKSHACVFPNLASEDLYHLAQCDVLVLAGLGISGEMAVDRWISTLEKPPIRVWTWTEEFALSGHAVALIGHDLFSEALDEDGYYRNRLTFGWNLDGIKLIEAGCGTSFHPYDAVDMLSTVVMAQRTIINAVLGKITQSIMYMWLGDRDAVISRGGKLSESFGSSYCEVSKAWKV